MNNTIRARTPVKRFSPWNYLALALVFISSVVYALPNLYGNDPSILITNRHAVISLETNLQQIILAQLNINEIPVKSSQLIDDRWQVRFYDVDSQFKAYSIINKILPNSYSVTYSLASRSPEWLNTIGASPMHLGLDLQGGIHLVYEIDTEAAIQKALDRYINEIKLFLQDANIRYRQIHIIDAASTDRGILLEFGTFQEQYNAFKTLSEVKRDLHYSIKMDHGQFSIIALINEEQKNTIAQQAMKRNISVFRLRANELGVSEPIIYKQGKNRIVVQLPGVQDPEYAIRILGSTATLEFRLVHEP